MHHFSTRSAIWRIRIAAYLFLFKISACIACAVCMAYAMNHFHNTHHICLVAPLLITIFVLFLTIRIIGYRTNCPLCRTAVFGIQRCTKNHKAKSLFGSYRLPMALSITFRNSFTCPYCGEPSKLTLRASAQPQEVPPQRVLDPSDY